MQVHKQFQDDDVVFIGLTDEEAIDLPDIKKFLADTGVTWLNGYGAGETLEQFGHNYNPQLWVIGRDGHIAWNEESNATLEEGIATALAAEVSDVL